MAAHLSLRLSQKVGKSIPIVFMHNEADRRPILVHIIRHGEREDEALRRERRIEEKTASTSENRSSVLPRNANPVRTYDVIDPLLTESGLEQAAFAFQTLLRAYEARGITRKLGFFSSPLQRAIGTALMASASGFLASQVVQIGFRGNDVGDLDCLPVIVLNGLCDCAAAVEKLGGVARVIERYRIPCADCRINDGSLNCPFAKAIQNTQTRISRRLLEDKNWEWVQFYRAYQSDCEDTSRIEFLPISPRVTAVQVDTCRNAQNDVQKIHVDVKGDTFLAAMDRAVYLAMADGCDTIVIVSHREGMRDMFVKCGRARYQVALPYCCISTFQACVHSNGCIEWCVRDISSVEKFDQSCLP